MHAALFLTRIIENLFVFFNSKFINKNTREDDLVFQYGKWKANGWIGSLSLFTKMKGILFSSPRMNPQYFKTDI